MEIIVFRIAPPHLGPGDVNVNILQPDPISQAFVFTLKWFFWQSFLFTVTYVGINYTSDVLFIARYGQNKNKCKSMRTSTH